jgi:2-polyprenyl-3-methyl-5-hydroxy-6-metoxy-1,4-benzoquinol methylase
MDEAVKRANDETRDAWNTNADFWDERMGEGNDFFEKLVWPASTRLLDLQAGERVLDIACGNGLTSRRMAIMGAEVVAFDFAEEMIEHARQRTPTFSTYIRYLVLDATDEAALLRLGEAGFDAALCNMALFDMAEIKPLLRALPRLLHPGGRFVFSMMHPCFNNPHAIQMAEMEDREGDLVTVYSVKVPRYLTPTISHGLAMAGQPKPQLYFHRSLQDLFAAFFEVGFVLDGLEEHAFPADDPPGKTALSWSGKFSEIPPALIVRMRLTK